MRRQKALHGTRRERLSACTIKAIKKEVRRQARMFDVSESFFIAVALANQLGIDEQESYLTEDKPRRRTPARVLRMVR